MITRLRHVWFTISGLLVLASIACIILFGFNLGLDFTGGARWDVSFTENTETITSDSISDWLSEQVDVTKAPQIQATQDAGRYLITIQDLPDETLQAIKADMQTELGAFEQKNYRKVDSSIGASFKKKSLYAVIVTLIGIILFVAFAFRKVPKSVNPWRFGGVAVVALFHDVIIILGIFTVLGAVLGLELDMPFITALLATLGFSVNDTIVILDRVRENVTTNRASGNFEETIQQSVQQTLHRSIHTSISTLLPLIGLLFLGAQSIFFFVLALILGIGVGTYSSIFLAAPMLVTWKDMGGKK